MWQFPERFCSPTKIMNAGDLLRAVDMDYENYSVERRVLRYLQVSEKDRNTKSFSVLVQ